MENLEINLDEQLKDGVKWRRVRMTTSEDPGITRRILLVSDGTGETAALMAKAAMIQFEGVTVNFTRYKNVRNEAQIDAICEDAKQNDALIIFTIVAPSLSGYLRAKAKSLDVPVIDLLGPHLHTLAGFIGYQPMAKVGILHSVDELYFRRIEAVEYTVAHDDGKDLTELEKADIVILGISRTSKTPLSMYLAHHGWRVANIPLVTGFVVPDELFKIDQRRVVALTIDGSELVKIRRARLERLGSDKGGDYAEPMKVLNEIEFARDLFSQNRKWSVFDVTGKALEETAAEIIRLMESRKFAPGMQGKKKQNLV